MQNQHTLFISDLHLDQSNPEAIAIFQAFIQKHAAQADCVYILGDFFEAWIGDDVDSPLSQAVCQALSNLTKKQVPVYFMAGNRDFLVGKHFAKKAGMILLNEPTVISLYGKPTLLMHGDTLCTADKTYQRFRKMIRSPFCTKTFLALPQRWRTKIAEKLRSTSQRSNRNKPSFIMDVTQSQVEKDLMKHHTELLIHGHTHRPAVHKFQINQKSYQRIVLGSWHQSGNMLVYKQNHEAELVFFNQGGFIPAPGEP